MTRIDTHSALAAVIRRQVKSLARPSGSGAASKSGSSLGEGGAATANGDLPAGDIATLVARRVSSIDPDDPNRSRKAFRVFLESVLLAEFGSDLINDAGFHQLVEDVHSQMEADRDLAPGMDAAAARMLAPRHAAR